MFRSSAEVYFTVPENSSSWSKRFRRQPLQNIVFSSIDYFLQTLLSTQLIFQPWLSTLESLSACSRPSLPVFLALTPSSLLRACHEMSASGVNVRDILCYLWWEHAYTSTRQVLRWSALIFGAGYGVYRQSVLDAKSKINEINREYEAKQSLIAKAKAEYVKKTMPKGSKTEGGGGESSFYPYYR